jgi:glycosyltransferase involved in cell wall biosynthesis
MKVAILTVVHPQIDVRIFFKEAVSLAEAGHQVTLFTPFHEGDAQAVQKRNIEYVPLMADGPRYLRPFRWWQLGRLLRQQRFDVWHFHNPELLPLAILWCWMFARSTMLVYDVPEDVPKDIMDKLWIPSFLRKPIAFLFDKVERWGARRCNLVIAATESIANRMSYFTTNCITVNNYPIIKPKNGIGVCVHEDSLVKTIYVGGLTAVRGIKEIVQAMTYLSDSPVKLTLLGSFYPDNFEREVRAIAGANVEIVSQVPFEQVSQYLECSDIGIACFLPVPNHVEAMPNKLFEYMEAGLAIIASDFPLWQKLIADNGCGILTNPSQPQQIAQAIRKLVENPELRAQMGQLGRLAVETRYSWKAQAAILVQAYERMQVS